MNFSLDRLLKDLSIRFKSSSYITLLIIISSCLFIYLSAVYLNISSQFLIGWSLLFIMFIMTKIKKMEEQPWRIIFLLMGAFVSLRYWFWRTTGTLFYIGLFDFIFMFMLYLAETYSISIHLLGMFVNVWGH